MNKVYEEILWQQFKEWIVGFKYRLKMEKSILELLEELQIKIVSELWDNRQNMSIGSKGHLTPRIALQAYSITCTSKKSWGHDMEV